MVAMAIAIGKDEELKNTRALILDEADASIPEAEAENFLAHVRRIADMGIPVIMVTHRLKEVKKYCDDISILNDGKLVYSGLVKDTTEDFIVSKMIRQENEGIALTGKEKSETYTLKNLWNLLGKQPCQKQETPLMEMKDIYARNINGLSFSLYTGDVLGIVGVPDSGVNELPKILGGDMEWESGSYFVEGKELLMKDSSPRRSYQAGVTMLPSDRLAMGGIMSYSLRDNICLPNEMQYWHRNKLSKKAMKMCDDIFGIQPKNKSDMAFGKFSGGNQQKAIMAKWLSVCPSVFVLDDPTYGVDPASRMKIFKTIKEASDMNIGIIIFSTEPEQLVNICTKVLALRAGKVECELKREDGSLTRETIVKWCYA